MLREDGKPSFPIWLLGDSEPLNWSAVLDVPFDSRHPIRHNIWTSIMDVVQDIVYRKDGRRIDASNIYIRNAITNPKDKPKNTEVNWSKSVQSEIKHFSALLKKYQPFIVFSFGAFAFEFANRASGGEERKYEYWRTIELGKEFIKRIDESNENLSNIVPLLHRSIAGGKFLRSHENFVGINQGNYFDYVAEHIAKVLLAKKNSLNIWIK